MSYEVIYRKQFIKVSENEFIPMVLIGSNNCYENRYNGKMRRERSWYNMPYLTNGKIYATLEEMLSKVNSDREEIIERNEETLKQYPDWEKYSDSNYGYFASLSIGGNGTNKTTFGMYKGIVIDGCKKALTVEQLKELGITVTVSNGYVDKPTTLEKIKHFPKTTTELINAIAELKEYYKDSGINVIVTYLNDVDRINQILSRENKIKRNKQRKPKEELKEYFVIRIPGYGYFSRKLKYGFKYSYSLSYLCKKFATEKQATKFANEFGRDSVIEKITSN